MVVIIIDVPSLLKRPLPRKVEGFALVELLVTIMALGLMALIGINAFGGVRQGAEDQKDKRNAQEIASMASVAHTAGAEFMVLDDKRATVEALRQGVTPGRGAFKGRVFQLPSLEDSDVEGALRFLSISGGELQYRMSGVANGP